MRQIKQWKLIEMKYFLIIHLGYQVIKFFCIIIFSLASPDVTASNIQVMLNHSGNVFYFPPYQAKVACQFDVTAYPYDTHVSDYYIIFKITIILLHAIISFTVTSVVHSSHDMLIRKRKGVRYSENPLIRKWKGFTTGYSECSLIRRKIRTLFTILRVH